MTLRQQRLNTFFKKLIAEFLQAESENDILITVTNVEIANGLRRARVSYIVYPDNKETAALIFLKKHQKKLNEFLKAHTRIKFIPAIIFEIDNGEKNRRKIEELLKNA